MRRQYPIALALVVALAMVLRLTRLWWGLGENLWFADESIWALRLHAFDTLTWKSFDTTGLGYPTLYQFLGGLGAWTLGLLGWSMHTSPATAIGWMRTVDATASILAVFVTGRLGMAMYGRWTGVAAAALLAVAPLEVMQVHYASVEPLLVLCTCLVMAGSWRLLQRGTASAALLAGACAGLASAAKYPGVAFVSVVAWAIGERWWLLRSFPSALGLTALASVGFVATFAVACPPCVVHADALLAMLRQHHQMSLFAGFEAACLVPSIGWWQRPWIYELVASLPYGLGLPLAVAAVAGVGVAFRHRTQADRLLLAVLLPYFAFMGASAVVYPRYMLPLFPGLALVAAAGLARTVRLWSATIVVGLVVSYGAALTASQLSRFTWNQQAAVADWLGDKRETLSPEDRRVGVPGILEADPYFHLRQPIAAQGFDVEIERPDRWLRTRPAFFVLPAWQAMAIHRDRRNFLLHAKLMQIEAGHAGYRPVLRIPIPTYLQRWFDEPWDPTFAVELWQGAIGFTVYARDGVLPELQTVDVLPPLPARRAVVPGSSSAG